MIFFLIYPERWKENHRVWFWSTVQEWNDFLGRHSGRMFFFFFLERECKVSRCSIGRFVSYCDCCRQQRQHVCKKNRRDLNLGQHVHSKLHMRYVYWQTSKILIGHEVINKKTKKLGRRAVMHGLHACVALFFVAVFGSTVLARCMLHIPRIHPLHLVLLSLCPFSVSSRSNSRAGKCR